ncbi:MAG: zinc-binding dehydrogenase, partial [Actinomycetota bacterium]|nr:zinc-binding dehydrogenase [Actinomycetota bacterium]
CHACRNGRPHICPGMRLIGGHEPGGMSQFVSVPAENLVAIPDTMPAGRAILTEPMAVAVHGVRRAAISSGETALVIGCGPVGLMTAMVLRAFGTERIILSDVAPGPLSRARALGFDDLIDVSSADPRVALEAMGFAEGVDVAFDCAGASGSPAAGLDALLPGGRLVLVGVAPAQIELDSVLLQRGERDIYGSMLYSTGDFHEAMQLLEGGIVPDDAMEAGIIRSDFSLEDSPKAFELLASGESPVLKLVIVHDGTTR